jgi:S-DNA-T family DNA segregation ATPase FtsK/SpoIIIE
LAGGGQVSPIWIGGSNLANICDPAAVLSQPGAPRSGRSQLLRTIATSIAVTCSCADVHLYGIDCGNGALLPLADLPHCGAVVTRTQAERAAG